MDTFGALIVVLVFFVLSLFGCVFLFTDSRPMAGIKKECSERGYIQNKDMRIFCQVEKQT